MLHADPATRETKPTDLDIPKEPRANARVRFLSPDDDSAKELAFRHEAGALRFTAPAFLVYGICVVDETP
jgi:hypothetical protein